MKKVRTLFALVLAVATVLAMSATAFAAPAQTTLKIKNPVEGHTYTAYQLIVGDLSTSESGGAKTLSNPKWGTDVAGSITYYEKASETATEFTVAKTIQPTAGDAVPQAVLDYLASLASNDQATANVVGAWVAGTGTTVSSTAVNVDTGYYVIKDAYTNPTADQTTTLSTFMCKVVGPTEAEPKAGTTEHHKFVLDVNDTTETAIDLTDLQGVADADWAKSADHDFGDKVPFKLVTTIGSDFAKYTSYHLEVVDTLGAGLKLNEDSIKVFVGGELAAKGTEDGNYTVSVEGQTFTVAFNKLNSAAGAAAGADVVVYYTATLDKDAAVIGNDGNPNTSYARFSNNPNGNQEGTGKTPEETVVVFTYKTDVDKVNPEGAPLSGAGFTLYKKYNAAVEGKTNVAGTTPAGAKADTFPSGEFWYAVKTIEAGDTTNFEFKGTDDGTYKLVESTTPNGYNTIDPITLTVTATHEASTGSTTGYAVTALNVDNSEFKAAANNGEIKFTKKNGSEKTLETGEIYSEIVNQSGATLPETGGIGTIIFYVLGSLLVVGCGIVLISKRRMESR